LASSRSADLTGTMYLFWQSFAVLNHVRPWKTAALPADGLLCIVVDKLYFSNF